MEFTYKRIWSVSYPVLAGLLMEQLVNITDAAFLGRVGETELAASALAGIYHMSVYMLGWGFSQGMQVVIAKRNGENRAAAIGPVFYQGLFFLVVLAVVVFILSEIFAPLLFRRLVVSETVCAATAEYTKWRNLGFLFSFPALAYRAFWVGITRTRILAVNSVCMVVTNGFLNYTLIFGNLGFPELGITGAAVASSMSGFVSLVCFVACTRKAGKNEYGLRFSFDGKILARLIGISGWTMVRSFLCVAPWFLFFVAIEHLGELQLAAANIVRSMAAVFFVIVNAFATTASVLVGRLMGAGDKSSVLPLCSRIVRLGYAAGFLLLVPAFVFPETVIGFYTDDPRLVREARYPYLVMLSNYFLAVPGYVYISAVIGTGNTKIAFEFQIVTIVLYLVYLFLISRESRVPLAVYWTAEHLYVLLLLVSSYSYMMRGKWVKNDF